MAESKTPTGLDFVNHRESCAYDRCRLHQAAPYLLSTLIGLTNLIQDGINVYNANQLSWLAQQKAYQNALAAIKKAENG